jgi:hypothetical protein
MSLDQDFESKTIIENQPENNLHISSQLEAIEKEQRRRSYRAIPKRQNADDKA